MANPRVVWADIGDAVTSLIGSAQKRVVVIAPFITDVAFQRVLEAVPSQAELVVITRWTASDVAAGISDPRIMDRLAGRPGARILLHSLLHAKIYMADEQRALVGSANVTDAALGFSPSPNREVLVELEPLPTALLTLLRRLEIEAVEASEDLRRLIEQAAAELPPPPRHAAGELTSLQVTTPRAWYPALRNPDRLFALYRSLDDASLDEREAALNDLAELALPDGLDEQAVRNAVKRHVLSCSHFVEFDAFVGTPRRFGELTDWLKSHDHGSLPLSHEMSQRCIQTLIRWLVFFIPERYALLQPHYSEVFGRRESMTSGE